MTELERMMADGYSRTETKVNGYELYEHENGKCVLYNPDTDTMRPFIEQPEYDCEG